ncbi:hypothetical protein BZA05DRAFT_62723 [Tricharina praecox]|uniref:uncharacterized protein n=1 Tax=Tricharina praecox TaxID=43433 RepID=UPI00221FCC50|nr:uncharacterized protein BZA05DRAFT_62723 [Tricharina praecox]KAI5850751.1 hypothetical protein BZA05DRAFT_62723 [Tricharina praecox]
MVTSIFAANHRQPTRNEPIYLPWHQRSTVLPPATCRSEKGPTEQKQKQKQLPVQGRGRCVRHRSLLRLMHVSRKQHSTAQLRTALYNSARLSAQLSTHHPSTSCVPSRPNDARPPPTTFLPGCIPFHFTPLHSTALHSSPLLSAPLRSSPLHQSTAHGANPVPSAATPQLPVSFFLSMICTNYSSSPRWKHLPIHPPTHRKERKEKTQARSK